MGVDRDERCGRDGAQTEARRPLTRARRAYGERFVLAGERVQELRYGENPHQSAGFYRVDAPPEGSLAAAELLGGAEGKGLSYNNILDLDAALSLAREFPERKPCIAIVKHGNPCGCALGASAALAWTKALACDPVSAFGSIVACNTTVDVALAEQIASPGNFVEALVAPSIDEDALEVLRGAKFGKNLRVLATGTPDGSMPPRVRSVSGGFLVQDEDRPQLDLQLEYASRRRPNGEELPDLRFAWAVCKHVRSNAIVFVKDEATVGVGAGQMSRVDSVGIAAEKAGDKARGAVLASDAFFPFPDGLVRAAEAGVTAAIQPGGSRKDADVIAAADERDVAMVLTGRRHFRH